MNRLLRKGKPFRMTKEQVKALEMGWTYTEKSYKINLERLQVKYAEINLDIIDFSIRKIDEYEGKARILVLKTKTGSLWGRRCYPNHGLRLVGML